MSELKIFAKQPITSEMIEFLVATTNLVIQVKTQKFSAMGDLYITKLTVLLTKFIKRLIAYSNVQTPTLMATLIYLNKLRNLLPANAVGMETTRHRIFLAALILLAKTLNDSLPLNKHWTSYTDGLLLLLEVNMAERELIALLKWDICIKEDELRVALQPFLQQISHQLRRKTAAEQEKKAQFYRLSNAHRKPLQSNSSILTYALNYSLLLLLLLQQLGLLLMLLLSLIVDEATHVLAYNGRKLVAPPPTSSRVPRPLAVLNA